jgi:hypothetical protein
MVAAAVLASVAGWRAGARGGLAFTRSGCPSSPSPLLHAQACTRRSSALSVALHQTLTLLRHICSRFPPPPPSLSCRQVEPAERLPLGAPVHLRHRHPLRRNGQSRHFLPLRSVTSLPTVAVCHVPPYRCGLSRHFLPLRSVTGLRRDVVTLGRDSRRTARRPDAGPMRPHVGALGARAGTRRRAVGLVCGGGRHATDTWTASRR